LTSTPTSPSTSTIHTALTTLADIEYGGVSLRQASLPSSTLRTWAKFLLPSSLLYTYAVTFPKLAIVAFYLSSFSDHPASKIICYVTAVTLCLNIIANTAAGLAICRPLHALWDGRIADHCFNISAWLRYGRVVNVVSDLVLLVLPVPHVFRLNLALGVKVAVVVLFLMGSLYASPLSSYLLRYFTTSTVALNTNENSGLVASILGLIHIPTTDAAADATYSAALVFLWSTVEIGMYHLASCMVAYLPLGKWIRSKIRAEPDDVERKEPNFVPRRRVDIYHPVRDYGDGEMAFVHEIGSAYSVGEMGVIRIGRRVYVEPVEWI
jgi:hypothetical protein